MRVGVLIAVAVIAAPIFASATPRQDLLRSIVLLKNKTETGMSRNEFDATVADVSTAVELARLKGKPANSVSELIRVAKYAASILNGNSEAALVFYLCITNQKADSFLKKTDPNGAPCRPDLLKLMDVLDYHENVSDGDLSVIVSLDDARQWVAIAAMTAVHAKAEAAIHALQGS